MRQIKQDVDGRDKPGHDDCFDEGSFMNDVIEVTVGDARNEPAILVAPAPSKDGPVSARDAMRSVVDWRRKAAAETRETSADVSAAPEPAASANESTAQAEGTAAETPPRETESADPVVETQPPIEPPRSWSKEDKELFRGLPRATQERLAERERSRDSDFSRRQQEATERAKALDAERGKVEQARTQYESALPQLLDTLQSQQAGEFADVRTIADVEKLAREDWPRYLQWD